mmetsp:Transcript_33375/g.56031  ORF Transcript_33375/g.56031 Transcript_33375/m.56031 type:complete len:210 (+) Transcript_33375:682-1311(+)
MSDKYSGSPGDHHGVRASLKEYVLPLEGIWMFGCVSTNSPIDGSSVKPCTPSPIDKTITVEDEYMQYPAATRFFAGARFRNSSARASSSSTSSPKSTRHSSSSLKIPNIVPVTIPTSILFDPSRGSNSAIYLEFHASSISIGGSFWNAKVPIFPVNRNEFFKIEFAVSYKLSLQLTSEPNRSVTPGRDSFVLIVLHAIWIDVIRLSKSA